MHVSLPLAGRDVRSALTLSLLLLGACRSGPADPAPIDSVAQIGRPIPVVAPQPATPVPALYRSANTSNEIRLVTATEPLPPLGIPSPAGQQSNPKELVPAPIHSVQPALSLTLFDVVELGLMQNPDLVALRYAEGVSEGALDVAQTYPFNPWVQIQVTPWQESNVSNTGPVNHYVLLMQQLQLAHQRRHRTNAAAAALNSVRWNYVQAKLLNMATTQRLYFTALYQRELADLARAQADLNSQLWATSERQLAAGQIAGADLAIVRLDHAAARRLAALADANYQTALLDLRRHLGVPLDVPLQLVGRLTDWRWQAVSPASPLASHFAEVEVPITADRAWLAGSLASTRPDVFAACADVETARANLDLARANRVPDLQLGPYYQRNNDPTTFLGFRAQMDIPVLNTGAPLVRQRLAELIQREMIWQQLLHRATLEAQAALDRYDRALAVISESDAAIPESLPPELSRLDQQFKAGEVDLLRIVAARASYFQARRALLDAMNEIALASSALTAATGLPPEAMLAPLK
jgi:cobalt-zinc-cadmium efflux system outer membrane protein